MSPAAQGQPVPPPPTPPVPAVIVGGDNGVTYTIAVPQSAHDLEAIREQRSELSNQLISATERRDRIAEQLKTAGGADKAGLEQRLAVLDKRIAQLESDIAETGALLTSAPAAAIAATQAPFTEFIQPHMVQKVATLFTLFVLAPIALSIAWAIFRRTMRPQPKQVESGDKGERLQRLENAVDAIAVEIERISEGQRFVTRLLTEQSPNASIGARQSQAARLGSHSDE